ncbi:hypothetical protein ACTHQ1_09090 [Janibacter anophelis]|uniref:hypothetical protein n=1 Tax=Janibacter anophelis TaxID=319054 RepID=UPI003F7EC254
MPEQPRPSRRILVTGAAWSLPAVSIAAAAPSLAASTTITTQAVPVKTFALTEESANTLAARAAAAVDETVVVQVAAASFLLQAPAGSADLPHLGLTLTASLPETLTATIRDSAGSGTHLRLTNGMITFASPSGVFLSAEVYAPYTLIAATGQTDMTFEEVTSGRYGPVHPFFTNATPGTHDMSLASISGTLGIYDGDNGNWIDDYPAFGRRWVISQTPGADTLFATVSLT